MFWRRMRGVCGVRGVRGLRGVRVVRVVRAVGAVVGGGPVRRVAHVSRCEQKQGKHTANILRQTSLGLRKILTPLKIALGRLTTLSAKVMCSHRGDSDTIFLSVSGICFVTFSYALKKQPPRVSAYHRLLSHK